MTLFRRVIELLAERGAADIVVFGGGIIPDEDIAELTRMGVARIFTPGRPDQLTSWPGSGPSWATKQRSARPSRSRPPVFPASRPLPLAAARRTQYLYYGIEYRLGGSVGDAVRSEPVSLTQAVYDAAVRDGPSRGRAAPGQVPFPCAPQPCGARRPAPAVRPPRAGPHHRVHAGFPR